jgi:DNA polymerase-3 subunit epsilon
MTLLRGEIADLRREKAPTEAQLRILHAYAVVDALRNAFRGLPDLAPATLDQVPMSAWRAADLSVEAVGWERLEALHKRDQQWLAGTFKAQAVHRDPVELAGPLKQAAQARSALLVAERAAKSGSPYSTKDRVRPVFVRRAERLAEGEVHAGLRKERADSMKKSSAEAKALAAIHASLGTFVVADCETTDLSSERDRLTEVSAIRCDIRGDVVESMSSLVKMEGKLPAKIVELTGITDQMIEREGRVEPAVMSDFLEFVGRSPVFFHNAPFDRGFLKAAAGRSCRSSLVIDDMEIHDSLALAKAVFPNLTSYKLADLAARFGLHSKPTHRGLADAQTTKELILLLRRASLKL